MPSVEHGQFQQIDGEVVAMRKALVGGIVLAMLLAAGAMSDALVAQPKKDDKAGVIEIGEGKDGKFRFFVRDSEGKLLAMSSPGGFATAKDAQAAIDQLKAVIAKAKVTTLKKEDKDKADK
jgi:hypothetical protein